VAFAAAWFADRPGEVIITWQGRRIETSLMVLVAVIALLTALATMLWSLMLALVRSPAALASRLRERRGVRAYQALSRGLVAVGSGDMRAARRFSGEAGRLAPSEPLALLLAAQTAQLAGDRDAAARTFQKMAARDDTRVLGLHGLFVEARRRNDPAAALFYAEEAARLAAVPGWAGQAVLEYRCVAGDWSGALERLERNANAGLIEKAAYRRERAVLLTAQALAAEDTVRDRAKGLAVEAAKLAPDLVPAAALAGRLLGESGEIRKAARIIEAAWRVNPHPDLADAYAYLRPGTSARERLARVQALAALSPGKVEAALAVARAALDAREFAAARAALAPLLASPTRRVAALMAELEEAEHGDEGRAREWMTRALSARRDPAWTADGFVSDRWLPVSPITGRLDAFEWKDPLAGQNHAGAVIEASAPPRLRDAHRRPGAATADNYAETEASARARGGAGDGKSRPVDDVGRSPVAPSEQRERTELTASSEREDTSSSATPSRRSFAPVAIPPAVIPLVHAPDDPGPEPEKKSEPAPEPPEEPPSDNWSRIRQLFKP
jgi:HemY protein